MIMKNMRFAALLALLVSIVAGVADAQPTSSRNDNALPQDLTRLPAIPESEAHRADAEPAEEEAEKEIEAEIVEEETPSTAEYIQLWIPPYNWEKSFELGLSGTEGNSQTIDLRFGGKFSRETDRSKKEVELNYVTKESDSRKTARNALLDGRIDWPLADSPWSLFAHGSGEYDEFKAFDLRLNTDAGVGYEFFKNDLTTLLGRLGSGVSHEIGGPDDEYVPELVCAAEWERKLSERQKMGVKIEYYPDVTDFGEYRGNARASWEVVVDPCWGMSLKLSVIDRYDSTPNGAKRNDLDYSALVLWSF